MANLPIQGSQYWGAAINNYLRKINSDIEAVKTELNNFTVAASYDGSGFKSGSYKPSFIFSDNDTIEGEGVVIDGSQVVSISANQSDKTFLEKLKIKLIGNAFFSAGGGQESYQINMTNETYRIIDFGVSDSTDSDTSNTTGGDSGSKRYVRTMSIKDDNYVIETRSKGLKSVLDETGSGFYPIYMVRVQGSANLGFCIAINLEKKYRYANNMILIGVLQYVKKDTNSYFNYILRADDSAKSLYETRKETSESYAALVNTPSETNSANELEIKTGVLKYVLFSNGLNPTYENQLSDTSTGGVADSALSYDQKTLTTASHKIIVIEPDFSTKGVDNEILSLINATNIKPSSSSIFEKDTSTGRPVNRLYGFYVSSSGDVFIEKTGVFDTAINTGIVAQHTWRLNIDSSFESGSLVFIGCCYYNSVDNIWCFAPAATNGIPPTLMSRLQSETTPYINLDEMNFLHTGQNASNNAQVKNIIFDADTSKDYNRYYLKMNLTSPSESSTTDKTIGVMNVVTLNNTEYEHDANTLKLKKITMTGDSTTVSSNFTVEGSTTLKALTIQEDLSVTGNITAAAATIPTITGSKIINKNISLEIGEDASSAFKIKNSDTNLLEIVKTSSSLDIKSPTATSISALGTMGVSSDSTMNITSAGEFTLKSSASHITLTSLDAIQCNNTINFTSDRRCKENINDANIDLLYNAVKNINVETYNYKDSSKETIGVIAQDIEKYLPEYKDLLIEIIDDGKLKDKRTVSEIKLLFVIWGALQKLIKKVEGEV